MRDRENVMKYFPIFVDLRSRPCLVVGSGMAATAKARRLVDSGADVTAISMDPTEELQVLADQRSLLLKRRAFKKSDVKGMVLVIAASGILSHDRLVSESAQEFGIPVNVVDRTNLSDFIVPAIINRSPMQIAISSGGAAPSLSVRVKEQVESILPERIGALATFARNQRSEIKRLLPDLGARRKFWRTFFNSSLARRMLSGIGGVTTGDVVKLVTNLGSYEQREGEVAIVGAGPGDPELLTIRALQKLQNADVIIYDRLVPPTILDRARPEAKRIFVGKKSGGHVCGQDEINRILLKQAQSGQQVVRLKGGDPFIFGRGGEERSFLLSHGITVDVVPGITAALGCGAATGIPMTHRNVTQAVTFITGHGETGTDLDWGSLARMQHSLVIYMGVASGGTIAARLIAHGMSELTPVGIVENGSLPEQKFVKGKLKNLGGLIEENGISAPAVIVIGRVVEQSNLSEAIVGTEVSLGNELAVCWDNTADSIKLSGTAR